MKIRQNIPTHLRASLCSIYEDIQFLDTNKDNNPIFDKLLDIVGQQHQIILSIVQNQYPPMETPKNPSGYFSYSTLEDWILNNRLHFETLQKGDCLAVLKSSRPIIIDNGFGFSTSNHTDKELYVARCDCPQSIYDLENYKGTEQNKIIIINNLIKQGE